MKLRALAASIAAAGFVGEIAMREAAASDFSQVIDLVRAAIRDVRRTMPEGWNFSLDSVFPDRAVVLAEGRYWSYPYTIGDDNRVVLGTPGEVVVDYAPVKAREEPVGARVAEAAATGRSSPVVAANASADHVFIEAVAGDAGAPPRYLVRVIKSGTSINGVDYPAAVLREAVSRFDGVRVFVKSDIAHLKGDPAAKDFRQLVGKLTEPRFVEAAGEIQAVLDVLETSDVAAKLREAVARGMTDLFGLSIDAVGSGKKKGKFREATKLMRVDSVDLIIEPGAGGQVIRFIEAAPTQESDMLRQQLLKYIEARDAKRAQALADASDEDVMTAYREAVAAEANPNDSTGSGSGSVAGAPAAVTAADVDARIRMVEARADARVAIAGSRLPAASQERLQVRFAEAASFTGTDVTKAIEDERAYIGRIAEGAQIRGLGSIEAGEDRADKVAAMLDDFFDRSKPATSFREAYIEITGDRRVTGLMSNCDMRRLREAVGEQRFAEAVNSTTWGNVLGDSITRAMIRDYGESEAYRDWRWACDVVPVSDFREQKRVRVGGYGNLPAVAENGPYNPLTSPGDEAAKYAPTKRGGTETISLETIANDDVGVIRRVPQNLATAAGRTLYEFVYDFFALNPVVYDGTALFHATHKNTGVAALGDASFAAARLAIKQQAELSSNKRLGLTLRHVVIPSDLEEQAYDMFVRGTNNDETFVQSRKPTVHVVDYWTNAKNWYATTDNVQCPLIEIGFYGSETPDLFVQDMPTQGSLFSNDQIKYKIRHIYGGAVRDYRGFYGALVP